VEYLGLDVGSSYLKIWGEEECGKTIVSKCIPHRGCPKDIVLHEVRMLSRMPDFLCYGGSLNNPACETWQCEGLLAEIDYLIGRYPHRHLLVFGAEKVEFVHYHDTGRILALQTNPPCAAGTGSFLDEQMSRLGLDPGQIEHIPIQEDAPMVATRCAVFAKTDLIHLQQEGYSPETMYNGLCKGLVISGLKSVFGGKIPEGEDILLSGGLLANPHILHFFKRMLPGATPVTLPLFTRARGLCRKARESCMKTDGFIQGLETEDGTSLKGDTPFRIELAKSSFPSQEVLRVHDCFDNELWHDIEQGEVLDAFLGVDIGSTSTKAVLVDGSDRIRLDIYTRTSGDPIEATRRIFTGIAHLEDCLGFTLTIQGCATTGSGRQLAGSVIGADLVINEISAHAAGAKTLDQDVETIFEIGGQDAKFIRVEHGRIVDVNMNYVCAAGTGSFVEELAHTLDMNLDEIGEMVMGREPLPNSDRCTVFMNQEITRQLSLGHPKERIMAGVLCAVFKNYLNRVVGNRYYRRDKIVFQGATARNKGLVACLEQITGAQIKVSPFCHVMGAYGAAILLKKLRLKDTAFRGLSIPEVAVTESICRGCENTCRITTATIGQETASWGYMCGRESGKKRPGRTVNPAMKVREDLLKRYLAHAASAGPGFKIPSLPLYDDFMPLFHEIAQACNISIEVCTPSKREIADELSTIGSGDFCYPIKVAMACTNILLRTFPRHYILLPFLIQDKPDERIQPRSLYCPFIAAFSSFYCQGPYRDRVITPVFDLSRKPSWQAGQISAMLEQAGITGISMYVLKKAMKKGMLEIDRYRHNLMAVGRTIMERLPKDNKIIVLFGRSYNLYNPVLNLGIPALIESMGYTVIPMDIVPDEAENPDVVEHFPDMYWYQGQKILRKALSVKGRPDMFPLMLSNFSCGPDSFILSYFEELCTDKPYLILELDEHGSATGYRTRIEAFCDMIEQFTACKKPDSTPRVSRIRYHIDDIPDTARIWIPQIHPYIPQLWSAILRRNGFDALPMGEETSSQCNTGKGFCRGSECLPAAVTIGKFLSCVASADSGKDNALFMPRAEGPCRFGQYATLQSRILDKAGIEQACIFSPTSENGYAFLSPATEREIWRATCVGDMLYKLRCRTIPYHPQPGALEAQFGQVLQDICTSMSIGQDWQGIVLSLVHELTSATRSTRERKPLVGIVGEIFVRLNSFSNQHVAEAVEAAGGEAWVAPMAEWIHYVWELMAFKGGLKNRLLSVVKKHVIHTVETEVRNLFSPLLDDLVEPSMTEVFNEAKRFVPVEFEGEAILTLGRARQFARDGAALVVNCSPFGCMPGRITSYIFRNNPEYCGIPVVNLFFDGTGDIASQVAIYINSITRTGSDRSHQILTSINDPVHGPVTLPGKTRRDLRQAARNEP